MVGGLSERDRRRLEERLEERRALAVKKMAKERERLAANAKLAAEREAAAERALAEHAARFGPKEIVGPDGVTVRLTAKRSGPQPESPVSDGGDLIIFLIVIPIYLLGMLVVRSVNWLVFRNRWTVLIAAPGRKKIKIRLRTEEAAVERLQEVADAVQIRGLVALPSS
jgi:hypothetical protein